ncbi:DinB family protein [Actinopolyspora halophila]|uniref:DinB family protein n=1 Tax=Actinopolyspora halophila TaxID=1850 RepID=UPI000379E757|nr:DinB family protein [Actinopolyspora halophila]
MSPLLTRQVTDDRDGLLTFLEQQRNALRAAAHGLDEQQARQRTTASTLNMATLLKHAVRTERRWVVVQIGQRELPGLWPMTDLEEEFRVEAHESLSGCLEAYSAVPAETERTVAEVSDLDAPLPLPPEMRDRTDIEPFSTRWVLLHLIEETARHAGHADIIRESLDGRLAHSLMSEFEASAVSEEPEGAPARGGT